MSEQAASFLLKILSGTQYGVEIGLDAGTVSFGSGDAADIRVADATLEPLHGELKLEAGRIELRSTGGAITSSSGLDLAGDDTGWHEIAQLDVLNAGTTRFAVGAPNAKWSRLIAEERKADPAARNGKTARRGSDNRTGAMLAGVAGVAALMGLAAGAVFFAKGAPDLNVLTAQAAVPPFDALKSSIEQLDFTDQVLVSKEVDGSIDVTGYVQNGRERNALLKVLDRTPMEGTPLRELVHVRDAITQEVGLLLDNRDVSIRSRLSPDGVLTLEGDVLDPAKARDVVNLIKAEVLGLRDVDNQIRSAETYLGEIEALLAELGLDGPVILRLDGLLVEATGVVPQARTDAWVGFVEAYSQRFAEILPLRSYVTLEGAPAGDRRPLLLGTPDAIDGADRVARVLTPEFFANGTALTIEDILGTPRTGSDTPVPAAAPATLSVQDPPDTPPDPRLPEIAASVAPLIARLADLNPPLFEALSDQRRTPDGMDPVLLSEALTLLRAGATPEELALLDLAQTTLVDPAANATTPPPAEPADPAAGRQVADADPSGGVVDLLNRKVDPETSDPKAGADTVVLESSLDPVTPDVTGFPDQAEPQALPAFDATERLDPDGKRLLQVAAQLRDTDPAKTDGISARVRDLLSSGPAARLFELAELQDKQLDQGKSILPIPLAAQPRPVGAALNTCWVGATITVEKLPVLLLWMEILSVDPAVDLSQIDGIDPRIFMEAALSPKRLRRCLESLDTPYARLLLDSSVFLSETAVNEDFAAYLLRNVPEFDLEMSGINLQGQRYLQLTNGRKLREGMAPSLDSRLLLIGDLGVLVRVPDGYNAALYGDEMAWKVE